MEHGIWRTKAYIQSGWSDVFIQPLFIAWVWGSGVCFVLALWFVMTTETAIDRYTAIAFSHIQIKAFVLSWTSFSHRKKTTHCDKLMVSQSKIIVLTLQDELGRGRQRNLAKLWRTNLVHTMQKTKRAASRRDSLYCWLLWSASQSLSLYPGRLITQSQNNQLNP